VTRWAQPPPWQCGRVGGWVRPERLAASAALTTGRRLVAGRYWLGHDAPLACGERRRACVRGDTVVVLPKQGVPTRAVRQSTSAATEPFRYRQAGGIDLWFLLIPAFDREARA
jgi:hypothetical protein